MKLPIVIVSALAALVLCASALRRPVAAVPIVALKVSPLAFSPNGDGVKDMLRASIDVDVPVTLVIEISDKAEATSSTRTLQALRRTRGRRRSTGTARSARRQEPGSAGREVHARSEGDRCGHGGRAANASAKFVLDTKPPLMLWGSGGVSPSILTSGPLRIRFRLYDLTPARVALNLVGQGGAKLKTGRGYR